ncbi:MAG: DNA-processing protein DprA [Microbacterium pygmaeum]
MTDILPAPDIARTALAPVVAHALDDELALHVFATAAWSHLAEPGDGVAGRIVGALGPATALHEVVTGGRDGAARNAAELTAQQWKDAIARWRPRWNQRAVLDNLDVARIARIRLLTPEDDQWPTALADLGVHAPLCLWVRGDPGALSLPSPRAAIVGARAATAYGEHVAAELAGELVARGVVVVSGAAYGIDGVAHRVALAAGGITAAVLAGGVERPYPTGHTDLIGRIAATGAVASEVPPGSAPTRWRFLQRNRLIAALSEATVVVEAGWRSGSLNTAGHAAALGRPVGAVPGPVTSAASAGCHRLLREFDARCITSADDVLELLGVPTGSTSWLPQTLFDMPDSTGRTDDSTRISDAMSVRSWRRTEDIARRAGMSADDTSAILGLLEIEGVVHRGQAGWRRAPAPGRP